MFSLFIKMFVNYSFYNFPKMLAKYFKKYASLYIQLQAENFYCLIGELWCQQLS